MKLFINSANLEEIKKVQDLGILDGVTTNSSIIVQLGIKGQDNIIKQYKDICAIVSGDVIVDTFSSNYEDIIHEVNNLTKIDFKIVPTIPISCDGIKAIKYLSSQGIKTNCSFICTPYQAILAAKAGSTYATIYSYKDDNSFSFDRNLIKDIRMIYDNYDFKTKILTGTQIDNKTFYLPKIEADVITLNFDNILELFSHPVTDKLAKLLEDYKNIIQ